MTDQKPAMTDGRAVYLGPRMGSDDKMGHLWIEESLFLKLAETATFAEIEPVASLFSPKAKATVIGGVYTTGMILNDAGRITSISLNPKYAGSVRLSHGPIIGHFELMSESDKSRDRAKKAQAKLATEPAVLDEIRYLSKLYQRTALPYRPSLELAIINMIRKGAR